MPVREKREEALIDTIAYRAKSLEGAGYIYTELHGLPLNDMQQTDKKKGGSLTCQHPSQ